MSNTGQIHTRRLSFYDASTKKLLMFFDICPGSAFHHLALGLNARIVCKPNYRTGVYHERRYVNYKEFQKLWSVLR
jgi:hypothetical protein